MKIQNNKNFLFDQKILNPLFKTMVLKKEEELVIRKELLKVIIGEMFIKILQSINKEESELLSKAVEQSKDDVQKLKVIQDFVKSSPSSEKIAKDYLENELPKLIQEILFSFLDKATPDQRRKFFELSK